jgi:alpha-beta hydrolase superfamily lysophospholipase
MVTETSWKSKDDLTLYGREWRPEGNTRAAIALVHGLGEHCARYDHVAGFFNQAGIGVLSFDHRGHGRSEGPLGHSPSYDQTMDDIQQLLDQTAQHFPGVPVILYGHSMGGNFVLYFGLTRKPKLPGIICTSPGLGTAAPVPGWKMTLARVMSKLNPTMQMDNGLPLDGLSHDQKVIDKYKADPLVHGKISARLALNMIENGQWIIQHASEFPVPLLLLQGAEDRVVNVELTKQFAASAPKKTTTFKLVDKGYHELHNEPFQQEVFDILLAWVNEHLAA